MYVCKCVCVYVLCVVSVMEGWKEEEREEKDTITGLDTHMHMLSLFLCVVHVCIKQM